MRRECLKHVASDRKKELDKVKETFDLVYDSVKHFRKKTEDNAKELGRVMERLKLGELCELADCQKLLRTQIANIDSPDYLD